MYGGYKIVVNTAAGRRRYMQYLIPFVVSSDVVDRYDIWINTHDGADIEFFRQCAERFPKINLVWQPDGVVGGISTINAFYRQCVEQDAIYFKMDDDLIWMEPGLIEKMVAFRVEHPEYFLVSPLVINNAISSYLLQVEGKIRFHKYYHSEAILSDLTLDGRLAAQLHDWFITRYLETGRYGELHVGPHPVSMNRFSINAILWFGSEMAKFDGVVPGDDEEFLSCIYPTRAGLANCWNGDAVAAHFAFGRQRAFLDSADVLGRYGRHMDEEWSRDERMAPVWDAVKAVMADVSARADELAARPSPYGVPEVARPDEGALKRTLRRILPKSVVSLLSRMMARPVERLILD